MPKRLAGIFLCLLLANVFNYALGEWLEAHLPNWEERVDSTDGSTLTTAQYYQALEVDIDLDEARISLLRFYAYLDDGGRDNYLAWYESRTDFAEEPMLQNALAQVAAVNTVKYLALLLLITTGILLYGKGLRSQSWVTPVIYLALFSVTAALFGGLQAPVFWGVCTASYVVYFLSLLVFTPIYRTEWTETMRPILTTLVFLLAVMAWRGQELVDYWFWTSPLFRLAFVFTLLLSNYFHFVRLDAAFKAARLRTVTARLFAYGIPLGLTFSAVGLTLGLLGADAGAGIGIMNQELALLTGEFVESFNPNASFTLFFAGTTVLILSGIGYSVQRIAQ
ncbi:hypothetical protein [Lewinella sp. 4G2]|uniref:hypothetical protein n=1 Tax=Lewinella sp. 4G2 TaxID=1803372 RepID=UPI0007B4C597|nr:hypothetical protein [Lewinella sp. 4G2]OAV45340.1 hypothetical protein A3850_012930 [Lewinella sp. 4G2]